MKATFIMAASLLVGTAALAQDATPAPSTATPLNATAPTPPAPPAATTAPAPDMSAPAATAPAPDMNSPAVTTGAQASSVAPPAPDTSNYPPCSATVQDRCVQTHELARKAGMPIHRTGHTRRH